MFDNFSRLLKWNTATDYTACPAYLREINTD